jgi:hypothetical protein
MSETQSPKVWEPQLLEPHSSCSSCIDTLDDLDWVTSSTFRARSTITSPAASTPARLAVDEQHDRQTDDQVHRRERHRLTDRGAQPRDA